MDPNPYQSPKTTSTPQDAENLDPRWRVFVPRPKRNFILLDRPNWVTLICIVQFAAIPIGMMLTLGTSLNLILRSMRACTYQWASI